MVLVIWGGVGAILLRFFRSVARHPELVDPLTLKILGVVIGAAGMLTLLASAISALGVVYGSEDARLLAPTPVTPLGRHLAHTAQVVVHGAWPLALVLPPFLGAVVLTRTTGLGSVPFVATALAGFVTLAVTAASGGIMLATVLVGLGGVRRVRLAGLLVTAGAAVGLATLLRDAAPGALAAFARTATAVGFVERLYAPTAAWSPTEWWAAALVAAARGRADWGAVTAMAGAMLVTLTAGASLMAVAYLPTLRRAWAAQGAGTRRAPRVAVLERLLTAVAGPVASQWAMKDLRRLQQRTGEWSPLLLAVVGMVLYVASIGQTAASMATPALAGLLTQGLAVANLGISALVIGSLCVHYVLPTWSLEGEVLWLVRAAPVNWHRVARAKVALAALGLVPVGVGISSAAAHRLGLPPVVVLASGVVAAVLTLTLVALALWFGARHPRLDALHGAQVATSGGGTRFLFAALAAILLMVAACAPWMLRAAGGGHVHPRLAPYLAVPGWAGWGLAASALGVGLGGVVWATRAAGRAAEIHVGGRQG